MAEQRRSGVVRGLLVFFGTLISLVSAHAWSAELALVDEARISWFSGKDIVACGTATTSASQSCWVVTNASSGSDLQNVLQGAFMGNLPASWIEERTTGYSLCAITAAKAKVCEPLHTPYVVGTNLTLGKHSSAGQQLQMIFPRGSSNVKARKAIGQTFFAAYRSAKKTLVSSLNFSARRFGSSVIVAAGTPNRVGSASFAAAKIVGLTTNECEDECDDGGSGGDGGGDPGDGGSGGGDSGGGDVGSSGGADPACVQGCNNYYYLTEVPRCNSYYLASDRQICFAQAANDYGACLATC
jgi:hypothetical protein